MDWDSTEATDGDWVVWWSRLDDRYQVEVTRDPDSTTRANLTIYDHADNNIEVHTEQVGLAYGAGFGPDTGDVDQWTAIALGVVSCPRCWGLGAGRCSCCRPAPSLSLASYPVRLEASALTC